jgi:hypothetical protein
MYAVIQSGGKQYRVAPGDTIRIERVKGDVGQEAHRFEVQKDQPVQDSTRPPAELHRRAGQRNQAVKTRLKRKDSSHGT